MGFNFLGRRPTAQGKEKNYFVTASTATPMQAPGLYTVFSTVSSTGASPKNYTLAAPKINQVGGRVEIHCIKSSTIKAPRVTLTAASLYSTVSSTSVTKDTIRFGRADQSVELIAISTSKWRLANAVNSPTITTS